MKFTENEIELIKQLYPTKGSKYVGELIGRSSRSILNKASSLGIKFDKSSDFFLEFHKRSNLTRTGKKRPEFSKILSLRYQKGELKIPSFKKHGLWKDRCYPIWNTMMNRCYNPKNKAFIYYGAKGIKVCEDWKDLNIFKKWYDNNFEINKSIDRINNNKDYEPINCRFATSSQQVRNRRKTRINNFLVRIVKVFHKDGVPQNKIAKIFNMNKITVNKLVLNKRWSDININYTPSVNSSTEVSKTSSLGAEPRGYANEEN